MDINCPDCGSKSITAKNYFKKAAGIIAAIGGASCGAKSALAGATTGARLLTNTGLVGSALGTIGGAIIGGLIGASSAGITGAKLGENLDKHLFDNYECKNCSHKFSHDDSPKETHT